MVADSARLPPPPPVTWRDQRSSSPHLQDPAVREIQSQFQRQRRLGHGKNAVSDSTQFSTNMTLLKAALLDGYDRTTPPPNLQVKIQFALQKILDVNTAAQTCECTS